MGARHAAARHRTDHQAPEPRTPNHPAPTRNHPARTPNRHARPGTSLPQLVGSGLAAAAGMALASELHLLGTTAGAVVFAVAATAGAPLIQLALHRAGDGCAALLHAAECALRRHRPEPGPGQAAGRGAGRGSEQGPGHAPGQRRGPGAGVGSGPRRALAPLAVGLLILGALAATGPTAVATAQPAEVALDHPPARDPSERGSTDKAASVLPYDIKSQTFRGS